MFPVDKTGFNPSIFRSHPIAMAHVNEAKQVAPKTHEVYQLELVIVPEKAATGKKGRVTGRLFKGGTSRNEWVNFKLWVHEV